MFSLAQAAKVAGKSKPTISRAIKAGKLSASRGEDGSYAIDPSELARVFPLTGDIPGTVKQSVPGNGAGTYPATAPGEFEGLRLLLAEREETIRDLRARLDREAEEATIPIVVHFGAEIGEDLRRRVGPPDADRHLSEHRYPGDQRRL